MARLTVNLDAFDLAETVSELGMLLETKSMPDHLRARVEALIDNGPLTRMEGTKVLPSEELLAVLANARALP